MLRPRIKNVHRPFALPGNRIVIGLMQHGIASEIEDDEDRTLERILVLMDGTRDVDAICADVARTHPGVDPDSVREVVDDLTANGFVEDAGAPTPVSAREADRYASPRHYFAWIDSTPRSSPYEIQARLKHASVALLGLGGTGSAVASGLVASGVGHLHCADFDTVEESNLCRQLLYDEADVGAPKVDRAVARLRAMNSLVEVTGEERRVTGADDVAELMAGRDAFVLCADQPQPDIMRWTNEAALRTGTPWFVSLYTGPMAVVGGYVPGETGCWECLFRWMNTQEHVSDSRVLFQGDRANAVIAASASVSGHLCALEVIYHLGGLPTQVRGRVLHWNFADWGHHYFIDVPHDADCPSCGHG
ncbi:bacteriocin biosynthesis cyclodehydratase domain-containing protein [Saccharothrix carnea]|uniref:Bacteriocin biosynthesis cyclodehydratase domain-containing protein n=1 Tax=Saccharothrix carnea TaxID=1280637 RepID=A0A2P8I2Y6_SACCR|nr:ThiF family adenylyltransferase [Saccharothrix carnea]PSL52827.1 bacteriocin biosynthesis cyclodehydratase domain-containing protein [Saccharothrix carnea]